MGFGKDGKGVIIRETRSQALGVLGSSGGIIIGANLATLERFRMLKSEVVATVVGLTASEGGGMALYLVDGNFTLAEFEASIENNGPVGPNESDEEELSERFIIWAGGTDHEVSDLGVLHNNEGGTMLEVKPRWTFARTKSWNWILYNHGVTLTTGATIKINCKDFGVWVT